MSSRSKPAGRFAAGLVGGSPTNPRRFLEHVPEKWTRFSDKDMLHVLELARILFDQVIPPDRKAR
jgi:hypothetical protein